MAEYITKDQAIEWFRPYGHTDEGIPFSTLKTDVMGMPAADVAPVVRCKDCIWYHRKACCPLACSGFEVEDGNLPRENDFCSYGERRE